jgi:hypothetical protein
MNNVKLCDHNSCLRLHNYLNILSSKFYSHFHDYGPDKRDQNHPKILLAYILAIENINCIAKWTYSDVLPQKNQGIQVQICIIIGTVCFLYSNSPHYSYLEVLVGLYFHDQMDTGSQKCYNSCRFSLIIAHVTCILDSEQQWSIIIIM